MSAATYNLNIDQGSDFAIQLTVKENSIAKDLTGYNARAQLRSTKTSSTISGTFTCTITDAANGLITMELSNAVSSAMSAGSYYYDLEIYTANDAFVARLLQGKVSIAQEVTR